MRISESDMPKEEAATPASAPLPEKILLELSSEELLCLDTLVTVGQGAILQAAGMQVGALLSISIMGALKIFKKQGTAAAKSAPNKLKALAAPFLHRAF